MSRTKITILNISVYKDTVYGLGKDNLIYVWNPKSLIWELYKTI
jgi:hypothetical protein